MSLSLQCVYPVTTTFINFGFQGLKIFFNYIFECNYYDTICMPRNLCACSTLRKISQAARTLSVIIKKQLFKLIYLSFECWVSFEKCESIFDFFSVLQLHYQFIKKIIIKKNLIEFNAPTSYNLKLKKQISFFYSRQNFLGQNRK